MNVKFNILTGNMGLKDTKWAQTSIYLFGVWTLLTAIVCFEKPDFLNLTIGCVGMFLMLDPQNIKNSYLRMIVLSLAVSEVYDLLWLFNKTDEYWDDLSENGLSQVILVLTIIMFFYKIMLFAVVWKSSLNFKKFVTQQRELVGLK